MTKIEDLKRKIADLERENMILQAELKLKKTSSFLNSIGSGNSFIIRGLDGVAFWIDRNGILHSRPEQYAPALLNLLNS